MYELSLRGSFFMFSHIKTGITISNVFYPKSIRTVFYPKSISTVFYPKSINTIFYPKSKSTVLNPKSVSTIFYPKSIIAMFFPKLISIILYPKSIGTVFYSEYSDTFTTYHTWSFFNMSILLSVDVFENCWMSGKQCRPRSDAAFRGVWSGSTLFCSGLSVYTLRLNTMISRQKMQRLTSEEM